MKLREPIEFKDILKLVRDNMDRGISYCIYSKISDSNDLMLDTICYLDNYPEITDDDEEIFSEFVTLNSLNFLFRDELIQDVVTNVLHQKSFASEQEILNAVSYYDEKDSFMNL